MYKTMYLNAAAIVSLMIYGALPASAEVAVRPYKCGKGTEINVVRGAEKLGLANSDMYVKLKVDPVQGGKVGVVLDFNGPDQIENFQGLELFVSADRKQRQSLRELGNDVTVTLSTTYVAAAAGDEVSAAIAALFGEHGQRYHALSAQANGFHEQFVRTLISSRDLYEDIEESNTIPDPNKAEPIALRRLIIEYAPKPSKFGGRVTKTDVKEIKIGLIKIVERESSGRKTILPSKILRTIENCSIEP